MKIIIDPGLKPSGPDRLSELTKKLSKLDHLMRDEMTGGKASLVHCEITDNTVTHASYTEYLGLCWGNHWGAVISPDIIRHLLLCQVGQLVNEWPEVFRRVFTASADKQQISLPGEGPLFPLEDLAAALTDKMGMSPTPWLTRFSGSTRQSIEANIVALAQAASPFYDYSMYMCGIPHVHLHGTQDDWRLLQNITSHLFSALMSCAAASDLEQPLEMWWKSTQRAVLDITSVLGDNEAAADLFRGMFQMRRCGSGSQHEVEGWITKLYRLVPPSRYPENYATNASRMDYVDLTAKKAYRMYSGLLYSSLADDVLVPKFGKLVLEKAEPVQ